MSSWKELGEIERELSAIDVAVFGVSADTCARLRQLREELRLPFSMLSDPMLTTADVLQVPTASKANLIATSVLHPIVRTYPKRSFLQPALFVWRGDGTLVHAWRQTKSGLTNLYGALGRPHADQVLQIVRGVV